MVDIGARLYVSACSPEWSTLALFPPLPAECWAYGLAPLSSLFSPFLASVHPCSEGRKPDLIGFSSAISAEWDHPETPKRCVALSPGPWLSGCSGKYPGLMTNRKISQLLSVAISMSARKLASLFWGFLNGLLYDLMQMHFMSMEPGMERALLIALIVNYVNR